MPEIKDPKVNKKVNKEGDPTKIYYGGIMGGRVFPDSVQYVPENMTPFQLWNNGLNPATVEREARYANKPEQEKKNLHDKLSSVEKGLKELHQMRKGTADYGDMIGIPEYAFGGDLMLPEHGFGSWLKDNGADLMKAAGPLATMIPVIGPIAGPALSIAGSVIGGIQENKQKQKLANEEQARLDEQARDQENLLAQQDFDARQANFSQGLQVRNYGTSIAKFGGTMGGMLDTPVGDPMITEYSNKAYKHGEGPNGVPVDSKGNPSATSKQSAVGLTEGGEVTWNGYVFSNRLEYKK